MVREQTIIKLPHTEIPLRAFDEPGFWFIVIVVIFLAMLWIRKK